MVPAPPPRRRPVSASTNAAALKAARLLRSSNRPCGAGSDDDDNPRQPAYADDLHPPSFNHGDNSQRHKRHNQELESDKYLEDDDEDEDDEDYSDMDDEEEDEDDDDDDANLLRCLHCHTESNEIQVRCDECSAYICDSCHWCHEFQANHEIRVCDRCDAFYCRQCDEVDQCDDCAEVVCASCSTLLSCKFCGGGICEECATACGRCGIVLCSRDAKFAVECDTCRLPYCLVCLASGSKDPCVRCRTRPSKRMEQLVHLRLKSIYKAFKQNSSSGSGPTSKSSNSRDRQNDDPDYYDHVADDPEALFQAAASAAKSGGSIANKNRGNSRYSRHKGSSADSTGSTSTLDKVIRFKEEKEKADAAASALLAELEEEEEAEKIKLKKKKKKKKGKPKEEEKFATVNEIADDDASSGNEDDAPNSGEETSQDDEKVPSNPTAEEAAAESEVTKESEDAVSPSVDPLENELCALVADEDIDGLEALMESIKGIPGRAILRKNAKKALKRLRLANAEEELEVTEPNPNPPAIEAPVAEVERKITDVPSSGVVVAAVPSPPQATSSEFNIKIMSYTHNKPSSQGANGSRSNHGGAGALRSECVIRIAPSIVGWVIGKGGQRIRDLMEESGARIWIDQNNLGVHDHRNVYVVGLRKNVETGVELIKELVAKATAPPASSPTSRLGTPVVEPAGLTLKNASSGMAPSIPESSDGTEVILKPKFGAAPSQSDVGRSPNGGADGRTRHVMTCEPRFVPLLIGRRGWTIKNIQDTTGVKVDIDQSVNPRKITISGGAEDNVQKAIRMVRDVLSYPHAQLPLGADDDVVVNVNDRAEIPVEDIPIPVLDLPLDPVYTETSEQVPSGGSNHPVPSSPLVPHSHSPPSSLIMTGDARTTTSATSSLSTTPEPDVQSNVITPFPNAEMEHQMPSPQNTRDIFAGTRHDLAQNTFNQVGPPPPSPIAAVAPPAFHPQPPTNDFFAPNPHRDVGFESLQLPGQSSHQMGHMLQQSSPSQQMRPTFLPANHQNGNFGSMPRHDGPSAPMQHGSVTFPQQNGYHIRNQQPMLNNFAKPAPTYWNGTNGNAHAVGGDLHDRPDPDGFRLDAAVEFLQHSAHHVKTPPGVPRNVNNFIGLSSPLVLSTVTTEENLLSGHRGGGGGGDDAQMIDSLFGPGPAVAGSSLLTGLQGLSLNEDVATTGLWGTSGTSDSIGLGGLSHHDLGPEPDPDPLGFAGLHSQPALLTTERKAQSRFAWGESGGR